MERRFLPIVALLILTAFTFQSGTVQMSYFKIDEEGNNLLISWQTREESNVKEYELYSYDPSNK